MKRSQLINLLIEKNGYKTYLEIGVNTPSQTGWVWDSIKADVKHGVDPNPATKATFVMTSDEFFATKASMKYDLIFVDGLHVFDQAYRDIENALKWLNDGGTIVVHDCNPLLEKHQQPVHTAGIWNGDVWKAILKLRMERPDLYIYTVDTDFGCGVIQKGSQELFKPEDMRDDVYSFEFFRANRKEILNLVSFHKFKRMMGVAGWLDKILP